MVRTIQKVTLPYISIFKARTVFLKYFHTFQAQRFCVPEQKRNCDLEDLSILCHMYYVVYVVTCAAYFVCRH